MRSRKTAKTGPDNGAAAVTDGERTRQDILRVATEEFAEHGLAGARVDAIAERTRTSKRMIYYYFGGKNGLYSAVLEKAYTDIRAEEARSDLANMPPRDALCRLIELTFDYDENHAKFVSLVSIENIHRARYLSKLPSIREINKSAIRTLENILRRGQAEGLFRQGIEALDLHLMITAFCFYRVSNRHTFEAIFACDLSNRKVRARHRKMIADAVLCMVEALPRPR